MLHGRDCLSQLASQRPSTASAPVEVEQRCRHGRLQTAPGSAGCRVPAQAAIALCSRRLISCCRQDVCVAVRMTAGAERARF